MIIETRNLTLRPWRETDSDRLYGIASNPVIGERAGWSAHQSQSESLQVIREILLNDRTWAITLNGKDDLVGCIGYMLEAPEDIQLKESEAYVGYWVAETMWNKGICTEALQALIEHCFLRRGFHRLVSCHYVDNPASGKVMEKCGFSPRKELILLDGKPTRVLELLNELTYCGTDCKECFMRDNCKGCCRSGGHPMGGDCPLANGCTNCKTLAECYQSCRIQKSKLIMEFSQLKIKDIGKIPELYALPGSFVNMEYPMPSGQSVRILKDENIYLGTQIEKEDGKCYGLAADDSYLIVSEYGKDGSDPRIVDMRRREIPNARKTTSEDTEEEDPLSPFRDVDSILSSLS